MPTLPSASIRLEEKAGAAGSLSGMLAIFGCCAANADKKPRVFASTDAMFALHGYSLALEFAALYVQGTKKPFIFVPLPITTTSTLTAVTSGNTGTSVITITRTGTGTTAYVDTVGQIKIVTGGTIGTAQIVFDLTLDNARTWRRVKLGLANSYVVPDVGLTIGFAAGTLVAGDTAATWTTTQPMWSDADFEDGRKALAAQQRGERGWLVAENCVAARATGVLTSVKAYETANDRFKVVRVQTRDKTESTFAEYTSTVDGEYTAIDAEKRINLGLGFGAMLSPITGWKYRRPIHWAATIREYQHDVHISTGRKTDGPLTNFDLYDDKGDLIEFDEAVHGGGLAGRFTCARTFSNGPNGPFVALDLTRETEGKRLSRHNNMQVANYACTVCHAATEDAIGQNLVLNDDGTPKEDAIRVIENRVNAALEFAMLTDKGEGARCSKCVWIASRLDKLAIPGATLNGVLELVLNGTVEQIATTVKVG
jgi:hypothetical protein